MSEEMVRLQKILAQLGVGSRRYCEILIERGRVSVNGQIVSELGARARLSDEIRVDGVLILTRPENHTYIFNKPRGVVSSMSDDRGRPSLAEYVESLPSRVFHVGRLDEQTEGLLILTSDGELAQKLAHPKYEVTKTYQALVRGKVSAATKQTLLEGVDLEDGLIQCDHVSIKQIHDEDTLVEVVLHSGRNRIVRRMLAKVGHPVLRLVRTHIGTLGLDGLKPGQLRQLTSEELRSLSRESEW
jgi:23S rRNA pseudouridine2605 synthase